MWDKKFQIKFKNYGPNTVGPSFVTFASGSLCPKIIITAQFGPGASCANRISSDLWH